jgi:hypothetical protein
MEREEQRREAERTYAANLPIPRLIDLLHEQHQSTVPSQEVFHSSVRGKLAFREGGFRVEELFDLRDEGGKSAFRPHLSGQTRAPSAFAKKEGRQEGKEGGKKSAPGT